jgi:hypothetical protein
MKFGGHQQRNYSDQNVINSGMAKNRYPISWEKTIPPRIRGVHYENELWKKVN